MPRAEKLFRPYYAGAIYVATLKRERSRINAEMAEAEAPSPTTVRSWRRHKTMISDGLFGRVQQTLHSRDIAGVPPAPS